MSSHKPFADLFAKLSPSKEQAQSAKAAALPEKKKKPALGNKSRESTLLPDHPDEEAALFMDAVRSIKPLPDKKKNEKTDHTLASALSVHQSSTNKAFADNATRQKTSEHNKSVTSPAPENPSRSEDASSKNKGATRNVTSSLAHGHSHAEDDVQQNEDDIFSHAMRGVAPIAGKGREVAPETAPNATFSPTDPAKALRDLLEGRVEFAVHHSDEYMEGYVVGVDPSILGRLRAGQLSPEAHLDLHGQNAAQALESLTWFIKHAYQRSLRTVTVITGRGKNSPNGIGILRPLLQDWLTKDPFKRVVLAFCTAHASDGGPGAVYVLLRKYKKSRGKIVWEHTPFTDGI